MKEEDDIGDAIDEIARILARKNFTAVEIFGILEAVKAMVVTTLDIEWRSMIDEEATSSSKSR